MPRSGAEEAPHDPPPGFGASGACWAGGVGHGADQAVGPRHVNGDGRLWILQDRVLLGAEAVEGLQRLLRPLVGDVVLPRLVERGGVALDRLVLERRGLLLEQVLVGGHRLVSQPLHVRGDRRLDDGGPEALQRVALPVERGQRPLQPLVLEDLGVGGLHLLHRRALGGEALLEGLALAADLQLVELLELLLGQLEAGLGGGVGALERGVRLEPAAVELVGGGSARLAGRPSALPGLRVRVAERACGRPPPAPPGWVLPAKRRTNSLSALDLVLRVALLLVDQRGAVLVLRRVLRLGEQVRVAREGRRGLGVALLALQQPGGVVQRGLAVLARPGSPSPASGSSRPPCRSRTSSPRSPPRGTAPRRRACDFG